MTKTCQYRYALCRIRQRTEYSVFHGTTQIPDSLQVGDLICSFITLLLRNLFTSSHVPTICMLGSIMYYFIFCFSTTIILLTCMYNLPHFQLSTVWTSISGSCVESGPPCSSLVHLLSLVLVLLCWCLASLLWRHFMRRFWNHTFTWINIW